MSSAEPALSDRPAVGRMILSGTFVLAIGLWTVHGWTAPLQRPETLTLTGALTAVFCVGMSHSKRSSLGSRLVGCVTLVLLWLLVFGGGLSYVPEPHDSAFFTPEVRKMLETQTK
jgi:hypothetical protein